MGKAVVVMGWCGKNKKKRLYIMPGIRIALRKEELTYTQHVYSLKFIIPPTD